MANRQLYSHRNFKTSSGLSWKQWCGLKDQSLKIEDSSRRTVKFNTTFCPREGSQTYLAVLLENGKTICGPLKSEHWGILTSESLKALKKSSVPKRVTYSHWDLLSSTVTGYTNYTSGMLWGLPLKQIWIQISKLLPVKKSLTMYCCLFVFLELWWSAVDDLLLRNNTEYIRGISLFPQLY